MAPPVPAPSTAPVTVPPTGSTMVPPTAPIKPPMSTPAFTPIPPRITPPMAENAPVQFETFDGAAVGTSTELLGLLISGTSTVGRVIGEDSVATGSALACTSTLVSADEKHGAPGSSLARSSPAFTEHRPVGSVLLRGLFKPYE